MYIFLAFPEIPSVSESITADFLLNHAFSQPAVAHTPNEFREN